MEVDILDQCPYLRGRLLRDSLLPALEKNTWLSLL